MNYEIKKQKLDKRIQDWQKQKPLIIKEQDLEADKQNVKDRKKEKNKSKEIEKKKTTTTKLLTFFLFASCTIIEIFTMYITVKQMNMGMGVDLTPLQMLIAAIVSEVVAFSIYSIKSLKENTKNGIIYETAMLNYKNSQQQKEEENIYQEAQG